MAFIWGRKNPSGRTDYYLRKTAWVEGRSRTVINIYPGTADDILDVFQRRSVPDYFELVSFRFGTAGAWKRHGGRGQRTALHADRQ